MPENIGVRVMDHIAIMVSDLERSYSFYHDLLGMQKQAYYEENI